MALVVSIASAGNENLARRSSSAFRERKQQPWMLKDFLRDDMSSCSSNGFRSFPRRQCCVVAVRNIIENDIRSSKPKRISRSRSVSSVIQRAVTKLLPFKIPAESPAVSSGDGKHSLPRSFSKKIFNRSFWKKKKKSASSEGQIERWISSGVVCGEKYQPSDLSNDTTTVTNASTTTSNSNSNSNSDGKSDDSWSDVTFTSDYLTGLGENDVVSRREKITAKDNEEVEVSRRGGVAVAAPIEPAALAKDAWLNKVSKKEQLSPISILDFPDNDEGSLSPFTLRISRLKDTQERLMKKLGRFESLAALGLEPLNLGSTLVSSIHDPVEDRSPKLISNYSCSAPSYNTSEEEETEDDEEEQSQENKAEKKLIGIRTGLPLPSLWEILIQLAVYFIIEDYTNYWLHRWLHSKWGYDNIHRVHHEYSAPIGFAAPYAHWAEVLILGIPTFLGPATAPGHMITFWLWIALRQIEAIETHSGYDFPWTPTKYIPFYGGAEYHDYHHYVGGQSQSNFASVFTYCDYIYGTDKGYRYQKKLVSKLKQESSETDQPKGLKSE